MKIISKAKSRQKRHQRVRARITGTAKIPRLSVFRSHKHVYAQLIDDEKMVTLVSANDLELKSKKQEKSAEKEGQTRSRKANTAYLVGQLIAEKALDKKIKKIVFDRGGYKYWGRVQALADGARDSGLIF
jgi:large subunit ribosomal protein L18